MIQYIEIDAEGFVIALYNNRAEPPEVPTGHQVYPNDPPMPYIPSGATPTQRLKWMGEGLAPEWIETAGLDEIKARRSAEITAAYLKANDTSFTFAEKEIQADAHAMKQINVTSSGIMRRNALVPGWPGVWKALDNSYVPIPDVATWWAMCDAIEATGHANFKKAQQLKAAISAATTAEQVAAIQWNQPAEQT